jgi:hypothetical protein
MRGRPIGATLAATLAIAFAASGAQAASTSLVSCSDVAGSSTSGSADHTRVVLGSVSVPPARIQSAQPDNSESPWRFFAKSGFEIHAGSQPVVVSVPVGWRNRVAITWGPVGAFSKVRFQACRHPGGLTGRWNGYAGGFYLNARTGCVPIRVTIGHRSMTAHVGIGTSCDSRQRRSPPAAEKVLLPTR